MATRTPKQAEPLKQPTLLVVGKDYFKDVLANRIQIAEEILNRQIQTRPQLEEAKQNYYDWDDYNSELLKQSFNNEYNEYKTDYDRVNQLFGLVVGGNRQRDELKEFKDKVQNKINNLKQLVAKVELIKSEVPDKVVSNSTTSSEDISNNNVFIVHGHNNEVKIN